MNEAAYIDINIHHSTEIFWCIMDSLPYMEGWISEKVVYIDGTANPYWIKYPNGIPSRFRFDMVKKVFKWIPDDEITSYDWTEITSLFEISELLELINAWAKTFQYTIPPLSDSRFFITEKDIRDLKKQINNKWIYSECPIEKKKLEKFMCYNKFSYIDKYYNCLDYTFKFSK